MKDDYKRLLKAAYELQGIVYASDIARFLTLHGYKASDQTMTNWKTRGISSAGKLAAAKALGCRVGYLETGELPVKEGQPEFSDTATKIAAIVSAMSADKQAKLLHYLEMNMEMERHNDLLTADGQG